MNYNTIQHILTLSIDAIAIAFTAMMLLDFAIALVSAWCGIFGKNCPDQKMPCKCGNPNRGICAETLAPIFDVVPELQMSEASFARNNSPQKCRTNLQKRSEGSAVSSGDGNFASWQDFADFGGHLGGFSIRELKKQASVAKIKNYSALTKAQLIEALSA